MSEKGSIYAHSTENMLIIDSSIIEITHDLSVNGDIFSNNLILNGELHGPSTFIIDPKPIDDISGTVQIKGNLQVLGNQTTIHSTIVDICDNRIRLNALNNLDAGIDVSINDTTKSFIYETSNNTWKIDDASLNINGTIQISAIN